MPDLKARIGERVSPWSDIKLEGNVSPESRHASIASPRSLLSRMGLDLTHKETDNFHATTSLPRKDMPTTCSSDVPVTFGPTLAVSNTEEVNGKNGCKQSSMSSDIFTRMPSQRTYPPSHDDNTFIKNETALSKRLSPGLDSTISSSSQVPSSTTYPPTPDSLQLEKILYTLSPPIAETATPIQQMDKDPSPTRGLQLRDVLFPIVIKNTQSRSKHDQILLSEAAQETVREALTDEFCESLAEKMRSIQRQMVALKSQVMENSPSLSPPRVEITTITKDTNDLVPSDLSNNPFSHTQSSMALVESDGHENHEKDYAPPVPVSIPELPKAPRAMRLRQQPNHESDTPSNALQESLPNNRGRDNGKDNSPASYGISVPKDATFFASPTSEKDNPTTPVSPMRLSDYRSGHPLVSRRPRSYSRQRSLSSPRRPLHGSPATKPYLRHVYSPPPREVVTHHRPSPFSHHHVSSLRSLSPSPSKRPAGPLSPDHHLPHSHLQRIPPSRPRRATTDRSRSPRRLALSPHSPSHEVATHIPPGSPHIRHQSAKSVLINTHDGLQYNRRHSLWTGSLFAQSAHGPHDDSTLRSHKVESTSGDKIAVSYSSPKFIKREPELENDGLFPALRSPLGATGIVSSCLTVPGLWFMKMGYNAAHVLECTFDVDEETGERWDILSKSSRDILSDQPAKLMLQLMCLSADLVQSIQGGLSANSIISKEAAIEFSKLETEWPKKGLLLIEVNPSNDWGRTWLPLEPFHPPLDLTRCIHRGTNVVRFIQLDDLTDYIFVLYAEPVSAEPAGGQSLNAPREVDLDIPQGTLGIPPAIVEVVS